MDTTKKEDNILGEMEDFVDKVEKGHADFIEKNGDFLDGINDEPQKDTAKEIEEIEDNLDRQINEAAIDLATKE